MAYARPHKRFEADRTLGWMVAICGSLLAIPAIRPAVEQWTGFPLWWQLPALGVVLCLICLGILGQHLPRGFVLAMWWTLPIANAVLLLTSYAAYRGTDFSGAVPWLWWFEVGFACLLAMVVRPAVAIMGLIVSATAPAISAFVFTEHLTPEILGSALQHLGNIVFVMLVIATKYRLTALTAAERDALSSQGSSLLAAAHRQQAQARALTVHDEVLSTLIAALRLKGENPPELASSARRALKALAPCDGESQDGFETERHLSAESAAQRLARAVTLASDRIRVEQRELDGAVPAKVIDTISLATGEAARNAVRHAGPEAAILCEISVGALGVEVFVHDDGPGFHPDNVSSDRIGVTDGLLGRMEALPGGRALIRQRESGTTVELTWHP